MDVSRAVPEFAALAGPLVPPIASVKDDAIRTDLRGDSARSTSVRNRPNLAV